MPTFNRFPLPANTNPPTLRCIEIKFRDGDENEYFRLLLSAIGLLANWNNYDRDVSHSARLVANVWKEALDSISYCSDEQPGVNCVTYKPNASIIQYFPQDPNTQPNFVPPGYVFPPMIVVGQNDVVNTLLGYLPGDVLTTISRILPFPAVTPPIGFPRMRLHLPSGGKLLLTLLAIESGGFAQISVDGEFKLEQDLQYTEFQFPLANTKEIDAELDLEKGKAHIVEIMFIPKALFTLPFFGFGGGLRKFEFCTDEKVIANDGCYEENMPIFREVEDNGKCYLEFECCPGEWVRLAREDEISPSSTPSGDGGQPAPGGGTAKYCQHMDAQGQFLLPATVSTGDIISLVSATGAGNDGVEAAWRCVDGSQFFAGACVGFPHTSGTDPLPAVNHMALILNVGGTFYPFTSGAFTVPSGVLNAQAYIQVNDVTLLGNQGSYDICVNVQNNQTDTTPTTWTHRFLGGLGQGSLIVPATGQPNGSYDAATDTIDCTLDTDGHYYAWANLHFASTTITRIIVHLHVTGNGIPTGDRSGITFDLGITDARFMAARDIGDLIVDSGAINEAHTDIFFALSNVSGGTSGYIGAIEISGLGTDPF
jgi:hypothetical protein